MPLKKYRSRFKKYPWAYGISWKFFKLHIFFVVLLKFQAKFQNRKSLKYIFVFNHLHYSLQTKIEISPDCIFSIVQPQLLSEKEKLCISKKLPASLYLQWSLPIPAIFFMQILPSGTQKSCEIAIKKKQQKEINYKLESNKEEKTAANAGSPKMSGIFAKYLRFFG